MPAHEQIRDHALVLAREPAPGPTEAGVDLVRDQQPALGVAERAQRGQEAGRGDALAPAPLHRLDQHRADGRAAGPRRAPDVRRVAEAREGGGARQARRERGAEVLSPGGVERAERQAVVGALEGHHARAPGREQGGLESRLDRVRAGRAEHAARGNAARIAPHQRFQQLDLRRGRVHVAEAVQQPLGLRGHGRDDAWDARGPRSRRRSRPSDR